MSQILQDSSYIIRWSLKTDYQIQVPADISEEEALENFKSDKYADVELTQFGLPYADKDSLTISKIEVYGAN